MADDPKDHTAFTPFGRFLEAAADKPQGIKKGEMLLEIGPDGHAREIGYVLTDAEFLKRIEQAPEPKS